MYEPISETDGDSPVFKRTCPLLPYFLNFLRASMPMPVPKRSMVAGSGTGALVDGGGSMTLAVTAGSLSAGKPETNPAWELDPSFLHPDRTTSNAITKKILLSIVL